MAQNRRNSLLRTVRTSQTTVVQSKGYVNTIAAHFHYPNPSFVKEDAFNQSTRSQNDILCITRYHGRAIKGVTSLAFWAFARPFRSRV